MDGGVSKRRLRTPDCDASEDPVIAWNVTVDLNWLSIAETPAADMQDFYNRKGLISSRGERKQAFFVLQKFYRELSSEMK